MELKPVDSSNLRAVGYDSDAMVLTIEFYSGGTYQYFDVPDTVYQGLLEAASKGQYFHQNIRGDFRYVRL